MSTERTSASAQAPGQFRIASEVEEGVRILSVAGELDVAGADELEAALLSALRDGASKLIVDLGDCEFIDSSGVRALIRGQGALGAQARLAVVAAHEQVLRILGLVGVDQRMPVAATRAEAIGRLG